MEALIKVTTMRINIIGVGAQAAASVMRECGDVLQAAGDMNAVRACAAGIVSEGLVC